MDPLAQQATRAALDQDWVTAIKLNERILSSYPEDLAANLRLANALLETGHVRLAKKYAEAALALDSTNRLAKRCLSKCASGSVSARTNKSKTNLKAFIETPGKTNILKLNQLAEPKLLATLRPGETVNLITSSHKVTVETENKNYIGKLPDDIAVRLASKRMNLWAALKSVSPTEVYILVHER